MGRSTLSQTITLISDMGVSRDQLTEVFSPVPSAARWAAFFAQWLPMAEELQRYSSDSAPRTMGASLAMVPQV